MGQGAGLGALLRNYREAKGLSLEQLSRATCIAPRQLLALEEGRLPDLPAPIFVRGFIRSYCAAVAEAPERALDMYSAWVTAIGPAPGQVPPAVFTQRRRWHGVHWRALARPLLMVGGVLVVAGGAAYLLASSAVGRGTSESRQPDQTTEARAARPETAVPASPAGVTAAPAAPTAAPLEPTPAGPVSPLLTGHVLVARVHEPTRIFVKPEDGDASRELLGPGTTRVWRSAGRFIVTLGDAGGVSLELDGVPLPRVGERGQVVRELRLPREGSP